MDFGYLYFHQIHKIASNKAEMFVQQIESIKRLVVSALFLLNQLSLLRFLTNSITLLKAVVYAVNL